MQTLRLVFFPKIWQKNNRKIPQPLFIRKQYKVSCFHKFSWQLAKGGPLDEMRSDEPQSQDAAHLPLSCPAPVDSRKSISVVFDCRLRSAQCAFWVVCFPSNQTNWDISWNFHLDKLFNIYLSLLVRLEGKHDSWGNRESQTLNPWFSLKYAPVFTPSSLNMPLYPSLLIVSDTGPFWLQGHRTSQSAHCAVQSRVSHSTNGCLSCQKIYMYIFDNR